MRKNENPAKRKILTMEELEKGPDLKDREKALIDGTAKNVRKYEVINLIDKLRRYNLASKCYAVRVRYRRFFPNDTKYRDCGYSICELEGAVQEDKLGALQSFLRVRGYPLQTLSPCPREPLKFRVTFPERLLAGMAASKLTPEKLAHAADIPLEVLLNYLNGTELPKPEFGKKLAHTMQVNEAWLMDKETTGFSAQELVEVYNQLSNLDRLRVYGLAHALTHKDDEMWL